MKFTPEGQAAFITGFFAIILYLIKIIVKPSNSLIAFSRSNTEERKIIQLMKQIRTEYNCSYVHIIQYHNGGKFYNGKPRQRLSLTHEVVKDGKKQLGHLYQELPVSYFAEMADCLEKKGFLKDINIPEQVSKYEDASYVPYYLNLIGETGAKVHYGYAVYKKFWILKTSWPFISREDRMVASIHLRFDYIDIFESIEEQMLLEKYIDEIKTILTV